MKTEPGRLHPDVRIGHIHLKVADLDRAIAFYHDVLGFELTQRYGRQAAFLSAGGYHDMHVAWLVGASTLMAQARDSWHGKLVALSQPAEETGEGAQAMINDHLFSHFPKPDVILGLPVMSMPAGVLACRSGVITSAGDSFEIRMFGRGAHGSMPEASVAPVVMAASTVLRLQTIVSRPPCCEPGRTLPPQPAGRLAGCRPAGNRRPPLPPGRATACLVASPGRGPGNAPESQPPADAVRAARRCSRWRR